MCGASTAFFFAVFSRIHAIETTDVDRPHVASH